MLIAKFSHAGNDCTVVLEDDVGVVVVSWHPTNIVTNKREAAEIRCFMVYPCALALGARQVRNFWLWTGASLPQRRKASCAVHAGSTRRLVRHGLFPIREQSHRSTALEQPTTITRRIELNGSVATDFEPNGDDSRSRARVRAARRRRP